MTMTPTTLHRLARSAARGPAALMSIALSILAVTPGAASAPPVPVDDARETHLADIRQLTFGGENAEAYWSPDGKELVFQSTRPPYACDQIFRVAVEGGAEPRRVSTGTGRTTCAYFTHPGAERILFASTHASGEACPPVPDRSAGYVWPIYAEYELWSAKPDGTDLVRLTENQAYDAEATVCPIDGSIVFTSTRDGDLELYRMKADGSDVRRLTQTPGYDGGAFFSADCSTIVWRAGRPAAGAELEDYQRLLADHKVRPGKLELWVANADGSDARQVTHLGAASFAPFFFPAGDRIIFSSNYGDPSGREFDIWAIDADGTDLERITWSPGFDGFPMFSPDGKWLAFGSNRRQKERGETNVFVARWVDAQAAAGAAAARTRHGGPSPADRYHDDVSWLAADEREGRGAGSAGLAAAGDWLEARFRALGLEPAGQDGGFRQRFRIPVGIVVEPSTSVEIGGRRLEAAEFQPAAFSASGSARGEVVAAGYGIRAPEVERDDYAGLDVRGKVVLVRRFVPEGAAFESPEAQNKYGDLRYKAWTAREAGAVALLVADVPENAAAAPEEAAWPSLRAESQGDAGIPVVFLKRAGAEPLFAGAPAQASLEVALRREEVEASNVLGRLRGGASASAGAKPLVVVGAHYDHLGRGGRGSLEPDSQAIHNGADDNASGTAALLEAARLLVERRATLGRDIIFAAFSGEENGLLGSTAYTRAPAAGASMEQMYAMLNLDMVGRLRDNRLSVLGGESAAEWAGIVPPVCAALGITCQLGGDGFGPSDQTAFYGAGVPVLHLFTGIHGDYHRPSDDAGRIHAAGGARVAALTANLAEAVAGRREPLTFQAHATPPPQGDVRASGASLGTVPDYAGPADGRPGLLLAGVRAGGPADKGGLKRGDLIVEVGGKPVREIHDFMYILRGAKPGDQAVVVVERDGRRVELVVTYGPPTRMR